MEGKSPPSSKEQAQASSSTSPGSQSQSRTASSNEERSKTIDCLVRERERTMSKSCSEFSLYEQAKLKDEEKKDKKRSPLLPWTKGNWATCERLSHSSAGLCLFLLAFIKWKRLSGEQISFGQQFVVSTIRSMFSFSDARNKQVSLLLCLRHCFAHRRLIFGEKLLSR